VDGNAIVGLVAVVAGAVFALIGWIVRSVDRRLDAVEKKADGNSIDIARVDTKVDERYYRHR
jgi:hypothetical protein